MVLEFANVSSAVPRAVTAGDGVGVAGAHRAEPARRRSSPKSSMELARAVAHRVELSADGQNLSVVFDDAPPAPPRRAPPPAAAPAAPANAGLERVEIADAPAVATQARARSRSRPPGRRRLPRRRRRRAARKTWRPRRSATPAIPVSLDFQGADLRSVLRTFSEISGLNLVIDPSIQGTVDVSLRDVPWDQALDIILRANRLGYVVDGTIVRVAPLTVLADEEGQRRKLQDEQALAGELRVMSRSLSYARAEDLKALLDGHGAVAARLDPDRRAHQHHHHQRPGRPPRARRRA